jgi:hypothetical protein
MKGFGVFVDIASSEGNQTTTLCVESTGANLWGAFSCHCLPGLAETYFGGYFHLIMMASNLLIRRTLRPVYITNNA